MKASPPEANQFTGNCFHMVRIVSKNCFLEIKEGCSILSYPILPHSYGPLRAVDGSYAPYKPSALLTIRILST